MITFFENKMKDILGSKVSIKNKKNNKGKIEIEYYSDEDLDRLLVLIEKTGNRKVMRQDDSTDSIGAEIRAAFVWTAGACGGDPIHSVYHPVCENQSGEKTV